MRKDYEHERRWGFNQKLNVLIGQQLKMRREKLGISQQEMAERLKTSQVTISRIERAEDNITLTKLERYAEALGVEFSIRFPINGREKQDILCKLPLKDLFQFRLTNHLLFTKLIGPISASHYSDEEQFLRQGRHHISRANTHRHHIITHEAKPQYDPGGHCKVFESEPELYILDRVRPSFTIN